MNPYFTPAYVIKNWYATNQPDGDGNYVLIQGRTQGLISFIMSIFKIEPTVELRVTKTHLHFGVSTFQGHDNNCSPLRSICSILSGYEKPFLKAAGLAISCIFFGLMIGAAASEGRSPWGILVGLCLGGLIGIAWGCVTYFLNKNFTIGFVLESGQTLWIRFKRSVIEGQNIELSDAEYVVKLVESLIESRAGPGARP